MKERLLEHLLRRAAFALRVWIIVGILLHVTRVRDLVPGLSLVFYTTPWPVVAVGLFLLALHHRRLGHGHLMRRYAVLTGGALFTWIAMSWYFGNGETRPADLRVVQWNVSRPVWRLPRMAAWLRAEDADIICVAEVEPRGLKTSDRWATEFSGYALRLGLGNTLVLVRGEILDSESGLLDEGSFFCIYRLVVRGRAITLLQVDLYARPTHSRATATDALVRLASKHEQAGEHVLIVGDFNTPRESWFLKALREKGFRHTFEAAGNGLAETWPTFAPALSLDQIWTSPNLQPLRCRHGWQWTSDHRSVVADVAFLTPAPRAR